MSIHKHIFSDNPWTEQNGQAETSAPDNQEHTKTSNHNIMLPLDTICFGTLTDSLVVEL
jgi:hypothetical protein